MRSARAGFGPLLPDDFDWSVFGSDGARAAERMQREDMLVAVADDLSGYAVFGPSGDEGSAGGEVWSLFVAPTAWGAGRASALLAFGLDWLGEQGFDRVTVWSFADNVRANRFYARWGFGPDGARDTLDAFADLEVRRLARALDTRASAGRGSQ